MSKEIPGIPHRRILAIYADDWSIDDGPTDINHAFSLYSAWVVGFLIRETDEFITLSPEIFDDRVRHTQTIPKSASRVVHVIRHEDEQT